jgi:signal transduction histidine kinase
MNALPARLAVASLGLLLGALGLAEALVLAFQPGVTLGALLVPTVIGVLLAFVAAGLVLVQARRFVQELAALPELVRTGRASLRALRFDESCGLFSVLEKPLVPGPQPGPVASPREVDGLALRVRFIAAMGHDLRNPLNAMLGFADLLALDPGAAWNRSQMTSLAILRERTRDLLSLIDAMIDWARLEAGQLPMARASWPVAELIERALTEAKERSGARGLTVHVELAAELGAVHVDAGRFVQALVGLMDQAARSDNKPALTLRAAREARGKAGEIFVRIDVIDAQLEIRDEEREHLFEAFRPSFAPTGRRIAGLRLGTAVARALMRAQGGDVWFERRPERGTSFVLAAPTSA